MGRLIMYLIKDIYKIIITIRGRDKRDKLLFLFIFSKENLRLTVENIGLIILAS